MGVVVDGGAKGLKSVLEQFNSTSDEHSMSSDPRSTCTSSSSPSTSLRLTAGVVNFLARRAMTTHHRPAAAPPFPLHSSGSSTGSVDSAPWSSCCHHCHAPATPPPLPSDTSDADEKLLLNVLSRH
ncbi:pathogen-inducible ethylene-responsive element-binding protein [Hordeum vulgare]|nr:pathogen-inducible ethylene-responsive element-binding protein [Hordeum vulgare]